MERAQNGWTGGQYSVLRATLALLAVAYGLDAWLWSDVGSSLQRWGAVGLLVLVALPLAFGVLDRFAAVGLSTLLLLHRFLDGVPELLTAWPAFESILLLHVFVPTAPYGAWTARGRPDPGGGWRLPDRLHDAAWLVVGLAHLLSGLAAVTSEVWTLTATPVDWVICGANLAFVPLSLVTRLRPLAFALGLATLTAGPVDGNLVLAVGAHLICFTPAWLAPRPGPPPTLFFDGGCGLCHRSVRFFLAEDPAGTALIYAPLSSQRFEALVSAEVRAGLGDSLVLVTVDGAVHNRSTAVIRCLDRLGGGWRVAGWVMRPFPRGLRDRVYDLVASNRHRLFASPESACPIL
ncbi:MAG: DUF393 domain-containing protein, partial [Myxococcota bacterium]|nr:DUF393 domain-containing protein [Myxococcota bacterium]